MSEDFSTVPEPAESFGEAPEKKKKTIWIIVAVVAVLLICCCVAVIGASLLGMLPAFMDEFMLEVTPLLFMV